MTRINTEPPRDLADQHLVAEYRELPRIFALARPLAPRERVESYRMGAGHVRFFYDKTGYLARRQAEIIRECLDRGFAIQHTAPPEPIEGLDGDWGPSPRDREICRDRLREKLEKKPGFYRYGGEVVPDDFYGPRSSCADVPVDLPSSMR